MKKTALYETHIALGARMVDFAGFQMPLHYGSLKEEHLTVRNAVGLFDVSHMGEFVIKGKEALQLVQKISSNDASKLAIGQAQYACLPNSTGGIVDDLLIYRLEESMGSEDEQAFLLVVNAANIEKDWKWINEANQYDCRVIDISDQTGLLALQGPQATSLLQHLCDMDLSTIQYYHFVKIQVAGIPNVLVSATGYTGSGGFELYVDNQYLPQLWNAIMQYAETHKCSPVGLGCRDTLRLEMGYCLYGNEIDETTSPIEAGLGWITKTKKTSDFFSKSIFIKQRKEGVDRKLIAFVVEERRVPRQGYAILDQDGNSIGVVTSGTSSPCLEKSIGMGYISADHASEGASIQILTGRKTLNAQVVKLPFYRKNG